MPELPEVQTIKLGLEKYLVGHTIEDVEIKLNRILSGDPKDIIGAKVKDIRRFGKGLVIDLSNNFSLAIHIKLTGQLIYQGPNVPKGIKVSKEKVGTIPNKFTHIIFHLDSLRHSGKQSENEAHPESVSHADKNRSWTSQDDEKDKDFLYYNDQRQFGWIKIVPTSKVQELQFFKELGPEPFGELTLEVFQKILSKSKTAIKPLIMDQKKIGGIGNIYANDSLYLAKIDPKRSANSLSGKEIKALYEAILTVMIKGLEEGGASELTFVNVLGQTGNYQNFTLVYGKQGTKCKRDGAIIQKIMFGGRGTYFCPKCQK